MLCTVPSDWITRPHLCLPLSLSLFNPFSLSLSLLFVVCFLFSLLLLQLKERQACIMQLKYWPLANSLFASTAGFQCGNGSSSLQGIRPGTVQGKCAVTSADLFKQQQEGLANSSNCVQDTITAKKPWVCQCGIFKIALPGQHFHLWQLDMSDHHLVCLTQWENVSPVFQHLFPDELFSQRC